MIFAREKYFIKCGTGATLAALFVKASLALVIP